MIIRYGKGGRVLSCEREERTESPGGGKAKGKKVLRVSEDDLPDDFLRTFALGKYKVSRKKIVERSDWSPPEPLGQDRPGASVEELIQELTGGADG